MDDKTKQAILDSIAHHKRMREWAKEQPSEMGKSYVKMNKAIGEWWNDDNCALCKLADLTKNGCSFCPLAQRYGNCDLEEDEEENENLYRTLPRASTWGDFVLAEDKFIPQLESLLEEEGKGNE